jgi:hypothetical protein
MSDTTLPAKTTKRAKLALQRSEPKKSEAIARQKERAQLADELVQNVLPEATGTQSVEVADRLIQQVANAQVWPRPKNVDESVIKAIATMKEMAPKTPTEALLAVHLIATSEAALMFLRRATAEGQTLEGSDANVLRATRLMRVFNEQLEAMQKLKGKAGQQKVTVEHVHVHQGGQAIVGEVNVSKSQCAGEGEKADVETITP